MGSSIDTPARPSQLLSRERKRLSLIDDLTRIADEIYYLNLKTPAGKKSAHVHVLEAANNLRSTFLQTQRQTQEVNQ